MNKYSTTFPDLSLELVFAQIAHYTLWFKFAFNNVYVNIMSSDILYISDYLFLKSVMELLISKLLVAMYYSIFER